MDGFVKIISDLMVEAGVKREDIYDQRRRELPGYFRPTKDWDIAVVSNGHLLAAIELKSQVGSFGNNCNNRSEEAIGNAVDLWTAYREGAFKTSPSPWVGYLFLLEDCQASTRPIQKLDAPHFPVFKEFVGASYAKRYELLCRRLIRERHYSGACFLMTDRTRSLRAANYSEPAPDLTADVFLNQLLRHVSSS